MIEPRSYENPRLQELIRILLDWINDELHADRIIVQDVEEDLYDGQVDCFVFWIRCYQPKNETQCQWYLISRLIQLPFPDSPEAFRETVRGATSGSGSYPVWRGPEKQTEDRSRFCQSRFGSSKGSEEMVRRISAHQKNRLHNSSPGKDLLSLLPLLLLKVISIFK